MHARVCIGQYDVHFTYDAGVCKISACFEHMLWGVVFKHGHDDVMSNSKRMLNKQDNGKLIRRVYLVGFP